MKPILKILFLFCFGIISCQTQNLGIYTGETKSEVQYISSSTIQLKEKDRFVFKSTHSYLGNEIPTTAITEIYGTYHLEKQEIILKPKHQRINKLRYQKNRNSEKATNGSRATVYLVSDTILGSLENITNGETMHFNFLKKKNSRYLLNGDNCFLKYDKTSVGNDLKNYCEEIID